MHHDTHTDTITSTHTHAYPHRDGHPHTYLFEQTVHTQIGQLSLIRINPASGECNNRDNLAFMRRRTGNNEAEHTAWVAHTIMLQKGARRGLLDIDVVLASL